MPVRFRCAYCNQLMGISHRKMGSVVRCPKCSGQVVVPNIETAPADASGPADRGAMQLLEGPELEMLLAGAAQKSPAEKKSKREGHALMEIDVEPVDFPPLPPPQEAPSDLAVVDSSRAVLPRLRGTVALPGWVLGVMATMMLLLLGLMFMLGFLLGRQAPK